MKKNITCWGVALCISVFGAFCVCLPVVLWKDMLSLDSALKVLGLVVSWPLAVLVLGLVFLTRFQGSLDHFLRNIRSVQFPGGNIQSQSDGTPGSTTPENIVLTPEQRDGLINHMAQLEQQHQAAAAGQEDLRQSLSATTIEMFQWKFAYLNMFYVHGTKQILHWFAQSGPQSRDSYTQVWQGAVPDANQRGIILDVLMQYGMLETDGTRITITQEGYGFLQFIGLIPYAPPQQGA